MFEIGEQRETAIGDLHRDREQRKTSPFTHNPFRVLGLPVTASSDRIGKEFSKVRAAHGKGKPKPPQKEFSFLPPVPRTPDTVAEAARNLQSPDDKLVAALFWFWKSTTVDRLAFESLKKGDTSAALRIWQGAISGAELDKKSFSQHRNLAILHLCLAESDESTRALHFDQGIRLFSESLTQEVLAAYARKVVGGSYEPVPETIARACGERLAAWARSTLAVTDQVLVQSLQRFGFGAGDRVIGALVDERIREVKDRIAHNETERKQRPDSGIALGESLFQDTRSVLSSLGEVLPPTDERYGMLSSALADELLQCAIDYFNSLGDYAPQHDPGRDAIRVARYAEEVAVGEQAKGHISDTLRLIHQLIREAPQREQRKKVNAIVHALTHEMEHLPDKTELTPQQLAQMPVIVSKFLQTCSPHLSELRKIFGISPTKRNTMLYDSDFHDDIAELLLDARHDVVVLHREPNFAFLEEFTIECKLAKVVGSDDIGFGVIWAVGSPEGKQKFDFFLINGTGCYAVGTFAGGWGEGLRWTPTPFLKTGDGANALMVRKSKECVEFYANDHLLLRRNGPGPSGGSGVGVYQSSETELEVVHLRVSSACDIDHGWVDNYKTYLQVSNTIAASALDLCLESVNRVASRPALNRVLAGVGLLEMEPALQEKYNTAKALVERTAAFVPPVQPVVHRKMAKRSSAVYLLMMAALLGVAVLVTLIHRSPVPERTVRSAAVSQVAAPQSVPKPVLQPPPATPSTRDPSLPLIAGGPVISRPQTGSSPYDAYFTSRVEDPASPMWIKFKNGDASDGIICLVEHATGHIIRNVYVRAGAEYRMAGIPEGTYYLKTYFGGQWMPEEAALSGKVHGVFRNPVGFTTSDDPRSLLIMERDDDGYSTYTVTVRSKPFGKVLQVAITADEFFAR